MPRFEKTQLEGIFKDVRSQIFYLRATLYRPSSSGRLEPVWVDKSLKTKSISRARELSRFIKDKIIHGEPVEKRKRYTFDDAFDLLLKVQSPKSDGTFEQSHDIVEYHLRPWFKAHANDLETFETRFEETWAQYKQEAAVTKVPKYLKTPEAIAEFRESKLRPRKLEHDRRYLVMALIRAANRGWIQKKFSKEHFYLNETTEPIGRYVSTKEVKRLLAATDGTSAIRLQILLALTMGMRLKEILHLRKEEVNLEKREIDLNPERLKVRKRREKPIPIADDVYPLLKAAFDQAEGACLFPAWFTNRVGQPKDPHRPQDSLTYSWDRVREQSGIEVRFHDLRHTAITNMLKAGLPDFIVRKYCGVSETTMRRIYAHLDEESHERFRELFRGIYVEEKKGG